jgi:hypothetical protein
MYTHMYMIEYRINPRYNTELKSLADKKVEILEDIHQERRKAATKLGLPDGSVKLERNKVRVGMCNDVQRVCVIVVGRKV